MLFSESGIISMGHSRRKRRRSYKRRIYQSHPELPVPYAESSI